MQLVGLETARHSGCRILHEIAMGAVVLRIHAGALPERPSRDEPVQFMLTGPDVDDMIELFRGIRKEIEASDTAATRKLEAAQS